MEAYDPLEDPDPVTWEGMGEVERIILVQDYHKKARIRLPNARLHAMVHTTVENQVALGDELLVKATLLRLMSEGLDRHEAVHAIGIVLTDVMHRMLMSKTVFDAADYAARLARLTAEAWRKMGEE